VRKVVGITCVCFLYASNNANLLQIDDVELKETQTNTSLARYTASIRTTFSINWSTVTYSDLRKPLHSAIASELYAILKTLNWGIPYTTREQAALWGDGNAGNKFTTMTEELERGKCTFL